MAPLWGLMGDGGETQGVALGWHGAHLWCWGWVGCWSVVLSVAWGWVSWWGAAG
jgi:hypothetical protein